MRLKHPQIPAELQLDKATAITLNKLQTKQSLPLPALNLAADCGSLAHLYMEMIVNKGLEHWPASRIDAASQAMQFWLLQRGHAKNEVEKQVAFIVSALKQTIASPQGAWLLARRVSTQAELSITVIGENNAVQEQRIDLTFVDEDELSKIKTRWIIDYKLTALNDAIDLDKAAEQHRAQLQHYASLFTGENLSIKKAVFFLSAGKLIEL